MKLWNYETEREFYQFMAVTLVTMVVVLVLVAVVAAWVAGRL